MFSRTRYEESELLYERFRVMASRYLNKPSFRDLRDRGVETGDVVHKVVLNRIFKKNKSDLDLVDRFDDPHKFAGAVCKLIVKCLQDVAPLFQVHFE